MTSSIQLSIFASRLNAVCEEMGAALKRAAFSPNIKDRLDFSCAVFDRDGELIAQAAHIPVHLGSMAYAMVDLVDAHDWVPGDVLVVNDPYKGGTHLPDVTIVAPVFSDNKLMAFAANRAHHASIGSSSPGSMPISHCLEEEGVIIPPTLLLQAGQWQYGVLGALSGGKSDPRGQGDFLAQVSGVQLGVSRLEELVESLSAEGFEQFQRALNDYAEQLALSHWQAIPDGQYHFQDVMDDDGLGHYDIPIKVTLHVNKGKILADFTGTAPQAEGNINCPLSVAAASVFYSLRCLLPDYAPSCAGIFRPIRIQAPRGCLVNAEYPAAVAAGNVETSSRIVDVVFGALLSALPDRIPAASQGTMNNLAMGSPEQDGNPAWDYYETIAGGGGASFAGIGMTARHSHMTNTLNTPVESIESHYPVRVKSYQIRRGSGGGGVHRGGDGVIREYEFLAPAQVTLLSERRRHEPWGVGANPGEVGQNFINKTLVDGKISVAVSKGDVLRIETPGGGGWKSSS